MNSDLLVMTVWVTFLELSLFTVCRRLISWGGQRERERARKQEREREREREREQRSGVSVLLCR